MKKRMLRAAVTICMLAALVITSAYTAGSSEVSVLAKEEKEETSETAADVKKEKSKTADKEKAEENDNKKEEAEKKAKEKEKQETTEKAQEEAKEEKKAVQTAQNNTGGNANASNNGSAGGNASQTYTPAPQPEPVHVHNYNIPVYGEEAVWIDTSGYVWTEITRCSTCHKDLTGFPAGGGYHVQEHALAGEAKGGTYSDVEQVWQESGYWGTQSVVTGYKCSCGAAQ